MFRLMDRQVSMDEAHFWMSEGHRQELGAELEGG